MAKKRIFKTDFGKIARPSDPEGLFRDLKGRSPDIQHLWSHQADLLRAYYENHLETSDIALELPTGAGKTLVGLLIAEFRRRSFDERVVYLCPTRQLAKQVGALASRYGINVHVLVGKQSDYPSAKFSEYQLGSAIAITTYSGLFNTNPKINDPQVIILDDAHAGENYICDLWSVEINRESHKELLLAIVDLFKSVLPSAFVDRLRLDDLPPFHRQDVDLVPGKYMHEKETALRSLLDSQLNEGESAMYPWQMVRDHLRACHLFINWRTVLLRPIIPPTQTHSPFEGAKQRVYMSATLGAGGELERITGIRDIKRLPIPPGWDKHGSGRRLFLIPELSLDEEAAIQSAVEAVKDIGRALILVPDYGTLNDTKTTLEKEDVDVLSASDIEDSLEGFTSKTNIALVLANRYDGIDLPGEKCRLLIVRGLPGSTNLQESFLLSRLATTSLLRDRMITRLNQAVGRCTRSDTDYAAVFLIDKDLIDFILKTENRKVLHPELQAELHFGIDNSKDKLESDYKELLQAFLDHGEEWEEAEKAILTMRDDKVRSEDIIADRLKKVVCNEVNYLYFLWNENYEKALEKARAVSDALEGEETKGYRGWWYYLTGDVALMTYEATKDLSFIDVAKEFFRRASNCSLSISWFAELSRLRIKDELIAEVDYLTPKAVEAVRKQLKMFGLVGKKFEDRITSFIKDINNDEYKAFHRGLKVLGELLGFEAENPTSNGAPDCVWSLEDMIHIAHEAKTEGGADGTIGINDVRQVESHVNWVKSNRTSTSETTILCLIETVRETLSKDALPHAIVAYRVEPKIIRQIAREIAEVLRSVRSEAVETGDEAMLDKLLKKMTAARLGPKDIIERLSQQLLKKMLVSRGKKS